MSNKIPPIMRNPQFIYKSGTVKVTKNSGRREEITILDDKFSTRKQLRQILWDFKGNEGVVVTVRFDDPGGGALLPADSKK